MTTPATRPSATPSVSSTVRPGPAQTHPCARCGSAVVLGVGLCERCNPLGLKDSASSQVHGSVLVAVVLAVALLSIAAHFAVAGVGPFTARVTSLTPGAAVGAFVATIEARNDGQTAGSASCRLTDPADPALIHTAVVYSPRIAPGQTATFSQEVGFGSADRPLAVTCKGP
jgi:hypothetical protein